MNKIIITVAGAAGTGKSTIAQLLRTCFQLAGFDNVELIKDGDELPSQSFAMRVHRLRDAEMKIEIHEVMTKKGA